MRHAGGDHRHRKALLGQAGILLDQQFPPFLPQVRPSGGRGVGQGLGGTQVVEMAHHRGQEHRVAILAGNADGGVVAMGLFLGLGAFGQNALGKIEPTAQLRHHRPDVRVLGLDQPVELAGLGADFGAGPQEFQRRFEPLAEPIELVLNRRRQAVAELLEEGRNLLRLFAPIGPADGQQLGQRLRWQVEPGQVEAFGRGHVADGRLAGAGLTAAASEDPLDDPQVLAVARPEELALLVGAEPVDVENLRPLLHAAAHFQPVLEIVAHVIAAEGQHGHRIAADLALLAVLRGRPLRGHCGPDEHAVLPVERLVDQRGQRGPAAAENQGRNGHARRVGDPRGIRGALGHRRGEAAIRVRPTTGLPLLSVMPGRHGRPCQSVPSAGGGPSPPSHHTVPSLASNTFV